VVAGDQGVHCGHDGGGGRVDSAAGAAVVREGLVHRVLGERRVEESHLAALGVDPAAVDDGRVPAERAVRDRDRRGRVDEQGGVDAPPFWAVLPLIVLETMSVVAPSSL
jgi:hypothetical protein